MARPGTLDADTCGVPDGWNGLDVLPPEDELVQGLLSNGWTCDAEWWRPVPDDMFKPGEWDGSGWGWSGLVCDADVELIAWRHWPELAWADAPVGGPQ